MVERQETESAEAVASYAPKTLARLDDLTASAERLPPRYFDPPLTDEQRLVADLEGWIFGVS
jgi:hypothetical protein